MKPLHTLRELAAARPDTPVVAAAGFFDGVHRGHQKILRTALQCARERRGEAWVLTFDTHPLRVLNPSAAPPLLTATPHKLRLLARMGVDGCLLLPFNAQTATTSPGQFMRELLDCSPPLTELVVGRNWRFGAQGGGDPALLARHCRNSTLAVRVMEPTRWKGETISSTRIRAAVLGGRLEQAATMLGRPFSVLGTVVPGQRMGRRLGAPTANLDTHNESLPPFGVYAAVALVTADEGGADHPPEAAHSAIVNFGVRPTFQPRASHGPVMEVHFLDTDRDLYGRDVEVFFIEKIRDERRFACADALRRQIVRDLAAAHRVLADGPPKKLKEYLYSQ